jgi:hypothetical protein
MSVTFALILTTALVPNLQADSLSSTRPPQPTEQQILAETLRARRQARDAIRKQRLARSIAQRG